MKVPRPPAWVIQAAAAVAMPVLGWLAMKGARIAVAAGKGALRKARERAEKTPGTADDVAVEAAEEALEEASDIINEEENND